jgi:ribosomal protein S18 acetylase RimI-like enzyme
MNEMNAVRPFASTDADYAAIAAIVAAYPPADTHDFEFRTAAEFRELDEAFAAAGRPLLRYLAEDRAAGWVAGFAQAFEIGWLPPPRRYWCNLRVYPDALRRGVGCSLYARLEADLAQLGARAMQLEAHEHSPAIAELLLARGFREVLRSWPFALDPRAGDLARFAGAARRIAPLELTTAAQEQARDEGWLARMYDLYLAIGREVPIPTHPLPAPPRAWFVQQLGALPEACFIVCDGERYAGVSYLHRSADEPRVLIQKLTGVRPEYRGRGLALALKLATIDFARRGGYARIETAVESNNPAMLAINRKLGFERRAGLILFEKRLGE